MKFLKKYKKPSMAKATLFAKPVIVLGIICLAINLVNFLLSLEGGKVNFWHLVAFVGLAIWGYSSAIKLAGDAEVSLGYAISFAGVLVFSQDFTGVVIYFATFVVGYIRNKQMIVPHLFNSAKNCLVANMIGVIFIGLQKNSDIFSIPNIFALTLSLLIPFCFDILITGVISSLAASQIPYKDRANFMDYLIRNYGIGSRQYLLTPFVGLFLVWAYKTAPIFLLFSLFTAYVVNLQLKNKQKEIEAIRKLTRFAIELIHKYDETTGGHSDRVHAFSLMICAKLGKNAKITREVGLAAALHDLGKIGVSQATINKDGNLTNEEFEEIKSHASLTAELVRLLPLIPDNIAQWASLHHEKVNGKGYPNGYLGEMIPEAALIIAVADVIDALIADRQYKRGWPIEEVLAVIVQGTGLHFEHKIAIAGAEVLVDIATKGSAQTYILEKDIVDF